uniref:Disease resistance N-terminal domain-containing protein n=1 Tax=Oryza glumipatula TaxID=40148 RepID=A0A0E0A438_9ORYZ
MADSTVSFVVGRLAEFVAKEAKVLQGVERDKLQWLHTFVQLADQRRRLNGNAYVDVWVQQTRDVSLEVEDVIDKFMVRVNSDRHLPIWSKCLKLSGRIAMITARLNQILLAPSMPLGTGRR